MNLSIRSGFLVSAFVFAFVLVGAAPSHAQAKGDAAKGKEVFDTNCSICHNSDSEEQKIGPGLKNLWKKPPHKLTDGTEHKTHTDALIREQILKGSSAMPPIGAALSEKELNDLMAYLHTL
jgi:mono/diheme cytochrome c family protein